MNTNLHHLKPPLLNPHLFFSPVNPYQFRHYKRRRLKPCLASGITLFLSQSNKFSKSSNIGEWVLFSSPTPFNRFVILRCPSISFEGSEFIENVNDKLVEGDRHFVTLNSGKIGVGRESGEGLKLEFQRVCVNTEDGGVISLDWPADLELEEEHGLETTLLLVPGTAKGSSEDNVRFLVVDALKRGFFPVVMNPRGCAASPITTARLFTAADSDDISTAIQFISKARPWTTLMGVGWGYGANMLTKYLAEVGECTPLTAATCINNPFDLEEATRCSPYHVALDQKLTGGLIDILQSNKEIFQGRAKGFDVENALVSKSVRDFDKAISMVSYGFEEIEDFYSKSSTRGMVGNVKIPVLFIQSDDGTVPLFSIPRSLIAENPFTSLLLCSSVPSSAVKSGRAAVSWCQNLTIEWLTAVELGLLKGRHPLLKDVDVNFNPSKGLPPVESRVSDKRVQLNKQSSLTPTDSSGYTLEPINKILQDIQSRSRKDSQRDLKLDEELQGVGNGVVQQRTSVDAELIEQDSADPVDIESGYTPEAINKILQDIQSRSRKDSQRDLKLDEELQGDENGVVQQRTSVDAELIEQDSADPVNIESGYTPEAINKILQDIQSRSRKDSQRELKLDEELQGDENGVVQQRTSVDAELIEQDSVDPVDIESGQAQQTAQVVMNMLDVMMPGTLTKEKKKVLTAVGQGETIMKALQDAVPEEVLGKLTTSVTGILQAQQRNLKVDGLLSSGEVPNIPITKIQEKVREVSSEEVTSKDPHSPDQMERAEDLTDGSVNNQPETEKSGAASEKELHSSKNIQKSIETIQSQVMSSQQGDPSGFDRKVPNESGHKNEKDEQGEKGLETSSIPNITSHSEKAGSTEETIIDESKVEQGGGTPLVEAKRENKNEEKTADSSADQNGVVSANMTEEPLPPAVSATDSQTIERDGNGDQKNEDKSADSSADQKRIVSANITEEPRPPEVSASDSETIETDGNGDQKRENKTMQPANDQNKPPTSDSNPPTFSVTEALDALTGMDDSTQVAVNSVFGVLENMISQFEEETDHEKIKNKNEAEGELVDSKPKKLENANDSGKLGLVEEEPTADPILYSGSGTRGSQGDTASNYEIKEEPKNDQLVSGKYLAGYDRHVNSIPLYVTANPYGDFLQNKYFHRYLLSKIPNSKPLDLDTTTALLLDYFPEEGKWKLLEHPGITGESVGGVITTSNDAGIKIQVYSSGKENDGENYIEPSYVVLDTEKLQEPVEEYSTVENITENGDDILDELIEFVKIVVLDDLRIEAGRKLGAASKKEMKSYLARDLELVADAVSLAVGRNKDHTWCLKGKYHRIEGTEEKVGTVQGEQIVKAISSAVLRTNNLRRLLPVGVIIGSSLAALRKYFNVVTRNKNDIKSSGQTQNHGQKSQDKACIKEMDHKLTIKTAHTTSLNSSINRDGEEATLKTTNNDRVMVGAVTAAFGASALLVQQQDPSNSKEGGESSPKFLKERGNLLKEAEKLEVTESEKNQNIVTSLAEKAMSVAGPVVPTKEDGGVDQERLVAMLANLGQQGGMLKLVGKIALLWGGIRGAMSLTDKLILFLHIAERPLYQRVLGFAGMVLVLWSPIFVPLLPTLVMSWTTSNPSRFAEFVCIVGLYTAIMILVTLWGRRIRGYEDPLEQYGLDLTALPKIQNFLWGLIGGVLLVGSIQSLNALLGCVTFSWPSSIPSSSLDAMTWLKMYVQMIMLAGRGIITASGIVLVEELLFRSWLPEEIKADVGYHQAIIISGLAFSLFQRSVWAIPGLWLFSLALAGFRQRSEGSLSIPIGLRTGIMASSFVLQTGGVLTYKSSYPVWVTGTPQLQPFSGAIGLAFSLLLAVMLYPRQPPLEEKSLARSSDEQ
ncbi:ALPHA/BETA-HYDROLASES SUPERFAMILY PROTEIN [Salix viminalis]|uniref:ALPHA/BETA-HYDROLASES SUPERFAMILY PROTEIN n=1 Tax=Salix viminalis TaxID=40686 RepID=A0A9Q0ZQ84_SALVM|nr:ALPHA/BETA-HYDROLASES SUPERFAMILY PROTEIN [Salix viminalis]